MTAPEALINIFIPAMIGWNSRYVADYIGLTKQPHNEHLLYNLWISLSVAFIMILIITPGLNLLTEWVK